MRHAARGFTLIELMIVVTIIGILFAIAIPVYQAYVTRAKIAEASQIVRPLKIAVTDYYVDRGTLPDNAAVLGVSTVTGRFVQSVVVQPAGTLLLTFGDPALSGQTITFVPTAGDGEVRWSCTSTLPPYLRPQECT